MPDLMNGLQALRPHPTFDDLLSGRIGGLNLPVVSGPSYTGGGPAATGSPPLSPAAFPTGPVPYRQLTLTPHQDYWEPPGGDFDPENMLVMHPGPRMAPMLQSSPDTGDWWLRHHRIEDARGLPEQAAAQLGAGNPLIQRVQNDNPPSGFNEVDAMGSKAGNMGEPHTQGALRPNLMSPTEQWLLKRKLQRIGVPNDNADFFGGA